MVVFPQIILPPRNTERSGAHVWAIINRYSVEANYKNIYHSWWLHLWGMLETNAASAACSTTYWEEEEALELIEATVSMHFGKVLMMLQVLWVREKGGRIFLSRILRL